MKKLFISSVAIEIAGIIGVGFGIGIEVAFGADFGFVLITGGSLAVAAGGLLFAKFVKGLK